MAKVILATTCPICCKPAGAPFRVFDAQGKVTMGCVDHFHTGHLVTPSESAAWHARPAAKALRADLKRSRHGFVTQVTAD